MFPSISFNAFTVGTGYKFGHFGVDLGLEYLIGADREIKPSDMKEDWIAMPGTHSMDIFAVSLGLNYYFD
jgi:long-subunit fatty acid transport protein